MDLIFIPKAVKQSITDHIDEFLKSSERYKVFGRAHKLSFLLTGVPGSGKSSLIKAIARKYSRPLYILSLSKHLDDDALIELASEIKSDSILLLEDIDAFFVDRETKDINISFSAFINVLDGATAPINGIIIFMTANNPERLDPALVRPGRVDRIIKFDNPQKTEIKDAFFAITQQSCDDEAANARFTQFYKIVGSMQISMAAIVDYLFRHTSNYLEHTEELAEHTKLLHEIANSKVDTMYR
jgi:chaperone BCS1